VSNRSAEWVTNAPGPEKLRSLPQAGKQRKPDNTSYQLDAIGYAIGDNEAIRRLNQARSGLLETTHETRIPAR